MGMILLYSIVNIIDILIGYSEDKIDAHFFDIFFKVFSSANLTVYYLMIYV